MKNLFIIIFICLGLFYLSGCYCCPLYTYLFNTRKMARETAILAGCESNMKNIATALEMYATDYSITKNGKTAYYYPANLNMISPEYIRTLPTCPKCNTQYLYVQLEGKTSYIVFCPGNGVHNKTGKVSPTGNFPQYTPDKGLIFN
jgi:hypothetical protein